MSEKQPEALMLADDCEGIGETDGWPQLIEAAAELRRLHQENEKLREAGVGYSQQTMDAVVRERENLRSLNAELLEALTLCRAELLKLCFADWSIIFALEKASCAIAKAGGE